MNYSFKGIYDSTKSYIPKDVVSFTNQGVTKYYFCLLPNEPGNVSQPSPSGDTDFWGIINNQSDFPNGVDTFLRRTNIRASDRQRLNRYQELILMNNLTSSQQDELENLTQELRDKLILPQDFNQLQQSVENLQMFFKDNVEGYIENKQDEFEDFTLSLEEDLLTFYDQSIISLEDTRDEFVVFVDGKKIDINREFDDAVNSMIARRNSFTNFVNTKQDEVRSLVQEFDSNSARYFQYWDAQQGQVVFNIYDGNRSGIPPEANLNIAVENVDLVINGTVMKPYSDYVIVQDGNFDKISLTSSAQNIIDSGSEVVARWFKNVGKLYFTHASSHEKGGSDEIKNIDKDQFNEDTKDMLVEVSSSQPSHGIWFKEV